MPDVMHDCSASQGFNFNADEQDLVGHITELKIGTLDLNNDKYKFTTIVDPCNNSSDTRLKVIGIVTSTHWGAGETDPITLCFRCNNDAMVELAKLAQSDMSDISVECSFQIYKYDDKNKKYYKCFHNGDEKLIGVLVRSGSSVELLVSQDRNMDIELPMNYDASIAFSPSEVKTLHLAYSTAAKLAKKFGTADGA